MRGALKGFPWHPHRGIETVTYLIHGDIEHGDSLGNSGSILDGCCQWMTAGSGIMHQEMPQASDWMLGVQLWINLPAKDKMTVPHYRDITADKVPRVKGEGYTVGVLSGEFNGVRGAVQGDFVRATFFDVEMQPDALFDIPTDPKANLFIYILNGGGTFSDPDSVATEAKRALLFGPGDSFRAKAMRDGLRFLLFAGRPLQEPVAWGGPIVMNTREELNQAFRDLDEGTFIRHKKPILD